MGEISKETQDRVISILTTSENFSKDTFRKISEDLNIPINIIFTINRKNKGRIKSLRKEYLDKIYEEKQKQQQQQEEQEKKQGEYMEIGKNVTDEELNPHTQQVEYLDSVSTNPDEIYVPRTMLDMIQHKPVTLGQKMHLAKTVEAESVLITEDRREIGWSQVAAIGKAQNISSTTAVAIAKEFTNVVIVKQYNKSEPVHRGNENPNKEQILSDLRETTLTNIEIGKLNNTTDSNVYQYKRYYNITRPDKEDEEVSRKTKARRKKLEEKTSSYKKSNNSAPIKVTEDKKKPEDATTSVKDLVKDINVVAEPDRKLHKFSCKCGFLHDESFYLTPLVVGKECSICHTVCERIGDNFTPNTSLRRVAPMVKETSTVPVEVKAPEEKTTTEAVKEFEKNINIGKINTSSLNFKPLIIEKLNNNKNITRILIEDSIESDLIYDRHPSPSHLGVFEMALDQDLLFDFPRQYKICEDFLKNNIKFNEDGIADKYVKLYCSGIQTAYTNFIKACNNLKVNLVTYHYNNIDHKYYPLEYCMDHPMVHSYGVGVGAIMKKFNSVNYRYKCTVRDIEQNTSNLYIVKCTENAGDGAASDCQIICTSESDYRELFLSIVNTLFKYNIRDFAVSVIEFNFSSTGEVVKYAEVDNYKR